MSPTVRISSQKNAVAAIIAMVPTKKVKATIEFKLDAFSGAKKSNAIVFSIINVLLYSEINVLLYSEHKIFLKVDKYSK
jgi:hypothetical protein